MSKVKAGKPRRIQIRPRIGKADLKVKAATIQRMLKKGSLVRVVVQFRGREITHPEVGMEKLKTLYGLIGDAGKMSVAPTLKNNELFLVVQPVKTKE